jgi:hypothetical protein
MNKIDIPNGAISPADLAIPGKREQVAEISKAAQSVGADIRANLQSQAIPVADLAIPGKSEEVTRVAEEAQSSVADPLLTEEDQLLKYGGVPRRATDKSR